MLPYNATLFLYGGLLLFALFTILYAGNAYRVNAQLSADDPHKRIYHPIEIILAPVIVPLWVLYSILNFIMQALIFGLVLVLLTIVLVFATALSAVRRPVHVQLLHRATVVYQE